MTGGPVNAPFTVGIHAGQLSQPVPGGVGSYVRSLLAALAADGSSVATRAFGASARPEAVPDGVLWTDLGMPRGSLRYEAWHRRRRAPAPVLCDVLHAPSAAIPPAGGRPLVVTVHDLSFLRHPEVSTSRGRAFHRKSLEITRDEASAIVTPSEFTRTELLEEGFEPERVHAIPHGADVVAAPTTEEIEWQLSAFSLDRPFVLTVGTIEPRKNLTLLAEAMRHLRATHPDIELVVAGPTGWGEVTGLDAPGIRVLGAVSRRQIDALFARAVVCCQPAVYEGFGLPALEAMTRGCPVVVAAGGAMEEVVGGAGVLVAPDDATAMANTLAWLIEDNAARDDLAKRGGARAATFSWSQCARAHVSIYEALAG